MPGDDGTAMPVDSSTDVNRILDLLTQDPNKLTQLKALINMQPEKDKNKLLLDDHTFRRIEKFSGEVGTFQERSFGLSMTARTVDHELGTALDEIKKSASTPLTEHTFQFKDSEEILLTLGSGVHGSRRLGRNTPNHCSEFSFR